jgi:DNA-binding PadR family transcriptional regulator
VRGERSARIGARGPEEHLPLNPAVLDIVLALGDEELHGYGIMREVRRRTDGRRRLAPGTPYRSPRQMQEKVLVKESEECPDPGLDDERRRYYRLTDLGRRVSVAEVERLGGVVRAARSKGLAEGPRPERTSLRRSRGRLMAARGEGFATLADTPVPANHGAGGSALAARCPAPAAVCSPVLIGLLRRRAQAIIWCKA